VVSACGRGERCCLLVREGHEKSEAREWGKLTRAQDFASKDMQERRCGDLTRARAATQRPEPGVDPPRLQLKV
jgi:hypothetical protein